MNEIHFALVLDSLSNFVLGEEVQLQIAADSRCLDLDKQLSSMYGEEVQGRIAAANVQCSGLDLDLD